MAGEEFSYDVYLTSLFKFPNAYGPNLRGSTGMDQENGKAIVKKARDFRKCYSKAIENASRHQILYGVQLLGNGQ